MCALYRPGPMDAIPDYIKRKHDPSLITYEVPELKPFLEETYGIIVYQEQVQRVVQEFAGFSLGAGYLLIKAVAKKIPALLKEQREKFIEGALKKGHKKQTAEKIFALIEPFTGYGFNKSHSACYARIAYETAFLKAHYPTAFMAALLSSDAQDTDRVMIEIEEADFSRRDFVEENEGALNVDSAAVAEHVTERFPEFWLIRNLSDAFEQGCYQTWFLFLE